MRESQPRRVSWPLSSSSSRPLRLLLACLPACELTGGCVCYVFAARNSSSVNRPDVMLGSRALALALTLSSPAPPSLLLSTTTRCECDAFTRRPLALQHIPSFIIISRLRRPCRCLFEVAMPPALQVCRNPSPKRHMKLLRVSGHPSAPCHAQRLLAIRPTFELLLTFAIVTPFSHQLFAETSISHVLICSKRPPCFDSFLPPRLLSPCWRFFL